MAPRWISLAILMACAVTDARERSHVSPTPAWLPRGAWAGLYIGPAAITQVRAQWLATVVQEPVNSFSLTAEAGFGYALGRPSGDFPGGEAQLTFMYQHVLLAGLSQRGDFAGGFHWGATLLTGPAFYGARFSGLPRENKVVGLVEGRLHAGWKFSAVRVGVTLGVAQVYEYPRFVNSAVLLGGPLVGLFAEWR